MDQAVRESAEQNRGVEEQLRRDDRPAIIPPHSRSWLLVGSIVRHKAGGHGGRSVPCQIRSLRSDAVDSAVTGSLPGRAHEHDAAIDAHVRQSQRFVAVDADGWRSRRDAGKRVRRRDGADLHQLVVRRPDRARGRLASNHRGGRVDLERERLGCFDVAKRVHGPVLQRVLSITGHLEGTDVGSPSAG